MKQLIGVVDCNNFFVSCERLFRPDLQRRPVAVLSSNDGCVVARSQEVKDMGIPMGVPYFKVKDIVKDNAVTLFSSHFTLYRDISRRVFSVLRQHLEEVEQYSVDEAFFVVPLELDPTEFATEIKDIIERQVGVPVSVGIAASKTQAKYAVEKAKQAHGIHVLKQLNWHKETESISIGDIWGVGARSVERYRKEGYQTVFDVINADTSRIRKLFGVVGERLQAELSGTAVHPVEQTTTEQKSLMSSRSFKEETTEKSVLADAVAYHTRHIAADLRRQAQAAVSIRVSIRPSRYSDFALQGGSAEAVLPAPSNDTLALLAVTQRLLDSLFVPQVPYKKVGVMVGQLRSTKQQQVSLFSDEKPSNEPLMAVIDAINTQADRELIVIGDRHRGGQWQARRELASPAYTTKWAEVAVAKA
jgi:DNA polymerase V